MEKKIVRNIAGDIMFKFFMAREFTFREDALEYIKQKDITEKAMSILNSEDSKKMVKRNEFEFKRNLKEFALNLPSKDSNDSIMMHKNYFR